MSGRRAYTADEKAVATSLALQHGVAVAAAQTGIPANTLRGWRQRRNSGLPLDATPQKTPRQQPHDRPEPPPLPDGCTRVDENGHIRTPRSLFISLSPSKGFWLEDRSNITTEWQGRRRLDSWRHRPVAAFAVVERINVGLGEPPWREIVGVVPNYGLDEECLVSECVHESELPCTGPHGCVGHLVEDLDIKKRTQEVIA